MRDWLRESRIKNGLSGREMAKKLGITEGYYSLIESGERQKKMDSTIIMKLSLALGVPTQQIVEYENR